MKRSVMDNTRSTLRHNCLNNMKLGSFIKDTTPDF